MRRLTIVDTRGAPARRAAHMTVQLPLSHPHDPGLRQASQPVTSASGEVRRRLNRAVSKTAACSLTLNRPRRPEYRQTLRLAFHASKFGLLPLIAYERPGVDTSGQDWTLMSAQLRHSFVRWPTVHRVVIVETGPDYAAEVPLPGARSTGER